ncbi:uncharacterized protein LOC142340130 isoform X2 [Convolutriloba macropyga]|uniref:uncharacterized protein LOC142340130 isoform X2 n=1 Tax=Convolutriloba macropyga TaxID=536237 RepID=UPI003F5261B7
MKQTQKSDLFNSESFPQILSRFEICYPKVTASSNLYKPFLPMMRFKLSHQTFKSVQQLTRQTSRIVLRPRRPVSFGCVIHDYPQALMPFKARTKIQIENQSYGLQGLLLFPLLAVFLVYVAINKHKQDKLNSLLSCEERPRTLSNFDIFIIEHGQLFPTEL